MIDIEVTAQLSRAVNAGHPVQLAEPLTHRRRRRSVAKEGKVAPTMGGPPPRRPNGGSVTRSALTAPHRSGIPPIWWTVWLCRQRGLTGKVLVLDGSAVGEP